MVEFGRLGTAALRAGRPAIILAATGLRVAIQATFRILRELGGRTAPIGVRIVSAGAALAAPSARAASLVPHRVRVFRARPAVLFLILLLLLALLPIVHRRAGHGIIKVGRVVPTAGVVRGRRVVARAVIALVVRCPELVRARAVGRAHPAKVVLSGGHNLALLIRLPLERRTGGALVVPPRPLRLALLTLDLGSINQPVTLCPLWGASVSLVVADILLVRYLGELPNTATFRNTKVRT
jgi:hypothetical protein